MKTVREYNIYVTKHGVTKVELKAFGIKRVLVTACGTDDFVYVFREQDKPRVSCYYHVLYVNTGLPYIGLQSFHVDNDTNGVMFVDYDNDFFLQEDACYQLLPNWEKLTPMALCKRLIEHM